MTSLVQKSLKGFQIFLHPKSPAAIYRDPRRFEVNLRAIILNLGLRTADLIQPQPRAECNICGWQGRKFGYTAAISVYYFVPDEICLKCGSNRRTRMLIALLAQHVNLTGPKLTVVEVGPSSSTWRYFAQYPNLQYLTVDCFKEADIKSDITDINLLSNSVDVIICCHVLEHVENYHQAMTELYRILKPGQHGIIAVPQTPGLRVSRRTTTAATFQGYGHIWEFGDDFSDQLARAGFQVATVYGATEEPFHIVSKPNASE